jgi:hypothetical protein
LRRHAKASSAGSSTRQASRLSRVVRGAFATRGVASRANGSGAPSTRRAPKLLLAAGLTLLGILILGATALADTAPTPAIGTPTEVAYTTAHLKGTVNPNGGPSTTSWHFQYSKDPVGEGWSDGPGGELSGAEAEESSPLPVAVDLAGGTLQPNTTYFVRLLASNDGGQNESGEEELTTEAVTPPTVSIPTSGEVAYTTAKASGEVTAGNADPAFNSPCHFDYVTDEHFTAEGFENPSQASCDVEPTGAGATPVSAELTGLAPATTYHLRLVATNAGGTSSEPAAGTFTTLAVAKPTVENLQVSNITSSSADFSGEVDSGAPAGPLSPAAEAAYETTWSFSPGGSSGTVLATEGTQTVLGEATNLQPNTGYTATIQATNAGGTQEQSVPFKTAGLVPTVAASTSYDPGQNEVVLRAVVNPKNDSLSTCRFDYGETESYGQSVPCASLPPVNNEGNEVEAHLSGLAAGADYHYRFVAANSTGPASTPDALFETLEEPSAEACPNEARRAEQHSTALPECRGYEMVSPLDKNGADVLRTTERFRVAPDGGAVGWAALAGFADTQGVAVAADYMSERTGTGWLTHALTPRQRSLSLVDAVSAQEPLYLGPYSSDLTRGVFFAISPLTDSPSVSSVPNLYLRTDLRTPGGGSFELVTACPLCDATSTPLPPLTGDPLSINRGRPVFANVSPDLGRVLFESRARLTSDAPAQPETCDPTAVFRFTASGLVSSGRCRLRLYEWDHGTVRLAGVLPDDDESAADVSIAASGASAGRLTPGALSDGSDGHDRVFFTQPTNAAGQTSSEVSPSSQTSINFSSLGNLFMRLDHASTEQLNLSERTDCGIANPGEAVKTPPDCTGAPAPDSFARAKFLDASADGTRAFFMTPQALTDDAPADADGLMKVYMYDATKPGTDPHNLTFVSRDDELGDGTGEAKGAIGVSADGSYFYFVNDTQLLSGGPVGPTWIYLWHNGQLKVVGPTDQLGPGVNELLASEQVWNLRPLQGRVTPDGRHLLFSDTLGESLTGYDDGNCGWGLDGGCRELYVYSADTDSVACASCNPSGAPATGNATIFVGDNTVGAARTDHPNTHPITPDGSRVFFTSPEALVPEDTNGAKDAYEYDVQTGAVSLLSSGTSKSDSYFIDNSPSGNDAFFVTRDRLVGHDTDDSYDLYDARVGGGFPEPPAQTAPCDGDSCRGPGSATPPALPLGSATLGGAGNVKGRHGCPRGRRPVRRHGRTSCVKKHGAKRHAKHNRRAGR